MQTDIILKYHWDVFLSHLCEFYPLPKEFIDRYEYELDWASISKSKVIKWDTDFLEKYQDRFLWHELAWNDSINWTIERADKFKKRLDWYYLGRNKNLPITEEFIIKFSKKLFVANNNPLLTKKLIQKFDLKIVPGITDTTQTLKRLDTSKLEIFFKKYDYSHNQQLLYKKVFLPIINKTGVEKIFETKFDYSQQYYFLEPIKTDIHGLTPEFYIVDPNPFSEYREGRGLFEIENKPALKNGSLQEGPDRLYEVPRLTGMSYYATILVSENVKTILEKFKLSNHIFHAVTLIPKKLATVTKYFILQLENDTLTKDLDFSSQEYFFNSTTHNSRNYGIIESKISDYKELEKVAENLEEKYETWSMNLKIFPNEFKLLTDFDMYSYSVHGRFIINQYLKDALEKSFPKQMSFKSAQLLNIKIDQKKYDDKATIYADTEETSRLDYKESEEDGYYYAKMERLESFDLPLNVTTEDAFTNKERELNIQFPTDFKNMIQKKTLTIPGYDLLPIGDYYLQNDYADRYPETYKSVAIAENGVGDSINLILERNGDHRLQNRLFEFFHETGEYNEIFI